MEKKRKAIVKNAKPFRFGDNYLIPGSDTELKGETDSRVFILHL